MMSLRIAALGVLLCAGVTGCSAGGPERASDIQNLHGISDDISAVNMTDSDRRWAHDPNEHSTLPRTSEIYDSR